MSYVKTQSMQRDTWVWQHMGLFNADQLRFQLFAKLVETSWLQRSALTSRGLKDWIGCALYCGSLASHSADIRAE